jgi:hypothetical protein
VQGDPVKVPVALLVKLTVPVGAVCPEDAVSATVAVHRVTWLTITDEGEQARVVVVGSLPKTTDAEP